MSEYTNPRSPKDEIQGIVYLPRLCDKARLHAKGELHPDYAPNLGIAMDQWACELFRVSYQEVVDKLVKENFTDEQLLEWLHADHYQPSAEEIGWWNSYMRNRGFRDDLSDLLKQRKEEAGFGDRDELKAFFDFLDADEGRS